MLERLKKLARGPMTEAEARAYFADLAAGTIGALLMIAFLVWWTAR